MFAPKSLEEFIELVEPIHRKSGEEKLTYKEKILLLMEGSLLLSEFAVKESFSLRFEPLRKVRRRPGKILLIQLSSIGDVLATTPVIKGLKEEWTESRLVLLTEETPAPLVRNNPYLDRVITFEREKFLSRVVEAKQPFYEIARELDSYLRRLVRTLRDEKFDLIINLHGTPRAALLSCLLKARRTSGLTIDEKGVPFVSENLWTLYKLFISCNPRMMDLDCLSHTQLNLKMASVKPRSLKPKIYLSNPLPTSRFPLPASPLIIGINPGTNIENKRWPVSNFAMLARKLKERYEAEVVIFGGGNDVGLAGEIVKQAKVPLLNLTGKTDLLELARLLKKCHLLITNDTGPMHIAGAVRTKTIVLCGPTRYGPYGQGHLLLQADLPCIGCGATFECQKMDCMKKIRVEDVLEAVRCSLRGELPELRGINVYSSSDSYRLPLFAENEVEVIGSAMVKILHLNLWAKEEARLNNKMKEPISLKRLCSHSAFKEAVRKNLSIFEGLRSDIEEAINLTNIRTKDKVEKAIAETNLSRIDFKLSQGEGRIFSFYEILSKDRLETYRRKLRACQEIITTIAKLSHRQ
ncbi:glycosyltransferase family 9 protein [bacterium]|nr:glycosyltransferase family 9 protein [bacterium]